MKRRGTKKKKKSRHQTKHHICPRSVGGTDEDNIVMLPKAWHAMWHQLFINLTIEEVHHFIDIVMEPNKIWTHNQLLLTIEAIQLGGEWR